jgi:hypothetical protein
VNDPCGQRGWSDAEMPLARYFLSVGGVLLALLFISDAYFPKFPVADSASSGFDRATIRIHSDRKWPERVVFDTSHPTIVPAQATAAAQASVPAPATVAGVPGRARVQDAFAQMQPSDQKQAKLSDPKKLDQQVPRKRKLAKRPAAPPVMLVAQQPQFGFFGNHTW